MITRLHTLLVLALVFAGLIGSIATAPCTKTEQFSNMTLAGVGNYLGGRLVSDAEYFNSSKSTYQHSEMNCQWKISRPNNSTLIYLIMLQVDLEVEHSDYAHCMLDSVTIYFTRTNGAGDELQICEKKHSVNLISSGDVSIHLIMDSYRGRWGIHFEWYFVPRADETRLREWEKGNVTTAQCTKIEQFSKMTLSGVGTYPGGRLVSHTEFFNSSESTYHRNMNCHWKISLPNNSTFILLTIPLLDLETAYHHNDCRYDMVTLMFTDAITGEIEGRQVCDSRHAGDFTSSSDVTIDFHSDRNIVRRGFHIEWYFVPRAKPLRNITTAHCTKIEQFSNMTLAGVGNFPGGRLVSHAEYFNSTNSDYHTNMNCSWKIVLPNSYTFIHLAILQIDLETGASQLPNPCIYDYLIFNYQDIKSSLPEVESHVCDNKYIKNFTSSSDVSIRFVTDHKIVKRGFHLEWYLVPRAEAFGLREWDDPDLAPRCPELMTTGRKVGLLIISHYQRNSHCAWQLTFKPVEEVVFVMNRMRLKKRFRLVRNVNSINTDDFSGQNKVIECSQAPNRLAIMSTDLSGGTITKYFCGQQPTNDLTTFTIRGGAVQITFTSDVPDNGLGYFLQYTVNTLNGDPQLHSANGSKSPLIIAVVLISLTIICTVLFIQRRNFIEKGRAFINRARLSHGLSYTTSNDRVTMVDDSK